MTGPRFLALTGGVGGAKLCLGLARTLAAEDVAFLVNTGDDFRHLGLHVSPDIDTLVYTLSEQANTELGWGRRGESWQFMDAMAALGGETWFRLGDKDLAMHIERTRRLAEGQALSRVTSEMAAKLGIAQRILPMSDDPVRTRVLTETGVMDFQHYFVRERCAPVVTGFEFEGADTARVNDEVLDWLGSPSLEGVILCPSNPFVSIDPILAMPGLRAGLKDCQAPVIAVSPVVGGEAIKGPTVKMMGELGVPNTAEWVAEHYRDFLDGFIIDNTDQALLDEVHGLGLEAVARQTIMVELQDRVNLAGDCLRFIRDINDRSSS
jgi:LPPG:FO 2-phospho-L-lactate transferase